MTGERRIAMTKMVQFILSRRNAPLGASTLTTASAFVLRKTAQAQQSAFSPSKSTSPQFQSGMCDHARSGVGFRG
jgi:hypothetical protein